MGGDEDHRSAPEGGASPPEDGAGGRPSLVVAVARALGLRCPACGAGGLVRRWVRVRERCPGCGRLTDRGEHDHFLGAMALNLVAAELVLAALLAGAMAATWPEPPWGLLTWGGAAAAVALPVLFYPFAKLCWLALDLRFRPGESPEGVPEGSPEEAPGENAGEGSEGRPADGAEEGSEVAGRGPRGPRGRDG